MFRIQFQVPYVKSHGATGTREIHLNNQISKFTKTSAVLLDRNSKHTAMAATACQKPRFQLLL